MSIGLVIDSRSSVEVERFRDLTISRPPAVTVVAVGRGGGFSWRARGWEWWEWDAGTPGGRMGSLGVCLVSCTA
jgi:hypothetical protein